MSTTFAPRFTSLAAPQLHSDGTPLKPFVSLHALSVRLQYHLLFVDDYHLASDFNAAVWAALGSDAVLLPVGKLDLPKSDDADPDASLRNAINYLRFDLSKPLAVLYMADVVESSLYAVPAWPGYYLVLENAWVQSQLGHSDAEISLYIYKLHKE